MVFCVDLLERKNVDIYKKELIEIYIWVFILILNKGVYLYMKKKVRG